jgi:hypothetical protein
MWNGMLSPSVSKSAGFLADSVHNDHPYVEVTEVVAGYATVVVHFNHTCEYNGKTYIPESNDIGYEYEYEVAEGSDEVDAQREVESIVQSKGIAALLAELETVDKNFNV